MKKFLVAAVFGLAGLAAFAGTCVFTHISIVPTDGTHMTFGGQVDNSSGANILQHNIVVAFLDFSNNLVETQTVSGCLRSIPNGQSDFFSATSANAASSITGANALARVAFDSAFKVGTTSPQNVSITNITAIRTTNATPATLTVAGRITNNASTTLVSPNVCIVVRTSAGNVLITRTDENLSDTVSGNNRAFSDSITVPNDSTASTVDIWVDGLDASGVPTTPQASLGRSVTTGGIADHLGYSTQPVGDVPVNSDIDTSPEVEILDANGDRVTSGSDSELTVTLSIESGTAPAGEALSCDDNTLDAVEGVATFTNCRLNHAAPGIRLRATASGITSANSNPFAIIPGAATALAFTTQPAGAVNHTAFATQPVVSVVDSNGDVVWTGTNSNATITLAAITGPSALAGCTTNPLVATEGVANFSNCSLTLAGTYSLTANGGSPALPQATSTSLVVS